jgi:hypothetical protein
MAIFPTAVSTDSDLFVAVNMVSTQLTDNPLTAGATTVNVVDASAFPSVGYLSIDNEIIKYAAKTATSFTSCTRAADGSVAAAHVQNSQIFHNVIAAHHNALKEEIKAVEQNLSDRIGLGSTQVKVPDGSVGAPSISFSSDIDTGLFRVAANRFALVTGGVSAWQVDSTAQWFSDVSTATIRNADGSASAPSYSFNSDPDTGIFRVGANELKVVLGGSGVLNLKTSGVSFAGTNTNDNAASGLVGEYVESLVTTATNFPATNIMGDLTSISLPAGDWDVTGVLYAIKGATTVVSYWAGGITATSGNSYTGVVGGSNYVLGGAFASDNENSLSIPSLRISVASTTTYYLKYNSTYTVSTLQAKGRLSARRVR